MKKISHTLLVLLAWIVISTNIQSSTAEVSSQGTIGEVRYSILPIDKFKKLNGAGWELLSGQSIKDENFRELTGLTKLPDARGMFIRGANAGRTNNGDPNGDTRKVGTEQLDAVGMHKHKFQDFTFAESQGGAENALSGNNGEMDGDNGPISPYAHETDDNGTIEDKSKPTHTDIDIETRPKNVNLYIYIKVSD